MGAPPYKRERLQYGLDLYYECERNWAEMARRLDRSRSACQHLVSRAKQAGLIPSVKVEGTSAEELKRENETLRVELEESRASLRIATKPHVTIRADTAHHREKIRAVVIGDAHDSPLIPDKSRFEWIGKYIRAQKPDVVIQIGDFATLDSLNAHIPNETLDGKLKPSFEADMGSFNLALQAMGDLSAFEKHETLGNHERRLYLYEQSHPEMEGKLHCSLDSILRNNGWTYSPYGELTFYGGVGFVHVPLNRLGKTYGGKTSEQQVSNDSICDIVYGHSHVRRSHKAPKIGPRNYVQAFNVGCALPHDHIEDYAKHALTGWSYGIADLIIQHGHISDDTWVSMQTLGERYGRKA